MSGTRKSQIAGVVMTFAGAGLLLAGVVTTVLLVECASLYPVGVGGVGALLIGVGTVVNAHAAERIKSRGYY